jgi:hypothetical protein
LLGFFSNLLAKFATLLASFRTALLTRRNGLFGFLVRIGGSGRRLRRLGQLDPAYDFVGYLRIRIHDDAHRDIEIVTVARGR